MSLVVPSSLPSAPSVAVGPTTVSSAVPGAGAMAVVNVNNLLNGKDSRWLQLEVCREFQRNKCTRPDTECKFAHPPANVEVQNGRVTACYDSIKVGGILYYLLLCIWARIGGLFHVDACLRWNFNVYGGSEECGLVTNGNFFVENLTFFVFDKWRFFCKRRRNWENGEKTLFVFLLDV